MPSAQQQSYHDQTQSHIQTSTYSSMRHLIQSESIQEASAFYVADLSVISRQAKLFKTLLPRVQPFYAVKCNPDPVIIQTLAKHDIAFDCASRDEISLVKSIISVHKMSSHVVYANPCKGEEHLKYAISNNVYLMTFDAIDELHKISRIAPAAKLLLRIAVDDINSLCPLSSKFGAHPQDVPVLLRHANKLQLNVVGVAFHVGSGCTSVHSYIAALERARDVFDIAIELRMPPLSVLDIGGGFPGHDAEAPITFGEIAKALRSRIDELFDWSVQVIAEPGRFFVTAAYSLATQIVSMRKRGLQTDYYIGDGVYGSFKDALVLDIRYVAKPLLALGKTAMNSKAKGNLYGPTQDPFDVVLRDVQLPEMDVGDWLVFPNMGAYTRCLATNLAGLKCPPVYYIGEKFV